MPSHVGSVKFFSRLTYTDSAYCINFAEISGWSSLIPPIWHLNRRKQISTSKRKHCFSRVSSKHMCRRAEINIVSQLQAAQLGMFDLTLTHKHWHPRSHSHAPTNNSHLSSRPTHSCELAIVSSHRRLHFSRRERKRLCGFVCFISGQLNGQITDFNNSQQCVINTAKGVWVLQVHRSARVPSVTTRFLQWAT